MSVYFTYKENKGFRLLNMYERLNKGEFLAKADLAKSFGVTTKTIQRDFEDLRAYLAEVHSTDRNASIVYDWKAKGYYLNKFEREWLTNEEVLAICKILLESRAFEKTELEAMIEKLLMQAAPKGREIVSRIIRNERFYYVPLKHEQKLLFPIWRLSQFVYYSEQVRFQYVRMDGQQRLHVVKPVAIMFSEYYFYLISYMADKCIDYPTIFRIDRMFDIQGTGNRFSIPYADKFNEGEFRKRVQFMFSGELKRVCFEYSGMSVEAVLDRLPTAEILDETDGVYTLQAETYGDGVFMWLNSQGDNVRILGV